VGCRQGSVCMHLAAAFRRLPVCCHCSCQPMHCGCPRLAAEHSGVLALQDKRREVVAKRQVAEDKWRAQFNKDERKKRYREAAAVEKRKELGKKRKVGKNKAAEGGGD
jgi:hypothetical protein